MVIPITIIVIVTIGIVIVVRRLKSRVARNIIGISLTRESRKFHTTIEYGCKFLRKIRGGAKTYKGLYLCKLTFEIVIIEKLPINLISNHMDKLIDKLVIRMIE